MKKLMKALEAIMLMIAVVFAAGCGGSLNDHDYVDLGLSSGTLWATCNVGATTPEGYGDYFAWGETEPKWFYSWSTYKYANGDDDQLTKYCNDSIFGYKGFTDDLTVLQPADDAATANWGSGWCMPSVDQWQELYQNTDHNWTTQNGVNGWLFTAWNGNSLFLHAAGYRWGCLRFIVGSFGGYWSSSFITDDPWNMDPWSFAFLPDNCSVNSNDRGRGLSIRAVRSSRKN